MRTAIMTGGGERREQGASDAGAQVSPQELEQYLHDAIPLSRAMQVAVLDVAEAQIILRAPLAPNVNHRGTVFGGSAYTLATLAAWSLLHCRLKRCPTPASVVLQSGSMRYQRPIAGAFSARAELRPAAQWPIFLRTLERRAKARISVCAQVLSGSEVAADFVGEFVALAEVSARPVAPQQR